MGLFSRNSGNPGQDDFDEMDLPNSDDLKGGLFTSDDTSPPTPNPNRATVSTPVQRRPSVKNSYGIEDAIKLMRSLPRDNNEVVVTVVKKTLESTAIQVIDIVEDANQKETRIRSQHKTLEDEIEELQNQIAQRNQQISDLLQDLKETTDVRQRLQLAMELAGEPAPQTTAQTTTSHQTAVNGNDPATNAVNTTVDNNGTSDGIPTSQQAAPRVTPNLDLDARRRNQPHPNQPH